MRLAFVALFTLSSVARAVTIVDEGEPAAVIVLAKRPHPVAFEAAIELQRVIQRISGAKLPIYLENEFHNGHEGPRRRLPRIYVGNSQSAREAGLSLDGLPPEGFRVLQTSFSPTRPSPDLPKTRPPKNTFTAIVLAGRDDEAFNWAWRGDRANRYTRGTAYAVYNFLEHDLGVRWLWPGELGEIVPQTDTIQVNVRNRTDAPRLRKRIVRNYFDYSVPQSWQARAKLGRLARHTRLAAETDLWLDHMGLGDSLPEWRVATEGRRGWVKKFGKKHPDWFAMQSDGSRLTQEMLGRVRICLSNPEVIEQILKEADDHFARYPELVMYGIELSDVFGSYCQCQTCKSWGPNQSDIVARHWKALGEQFATRHPQKLLYAHPYHTYFAAPTKVDSLPDNIMLWPVGRNVHGYTAEADRQASRDSWVGWARLNNQAMIWRPNFGHNDVGYPLNYARRIADDIKLFYKHKLAGVDVDHLRRNFAGTGLTYYVYTRLLWNPDRDVNAIIDDYCQKGFGPASATIAAYFEELEKLTTHIATTETTGFSPIGLPGGTTGSFGLAVHFTPETVRRLHALLDRALADADGNEIVQKRIEFLRSAVTYVEFERRVIAAGRKAADASLTETEVHALLTLLAERDSMLRSMDGTYQISTEGSLRGADWIQRIVEEEEQRLAGRDDFFDLWLENEPIMPLPEDWKFRTDPQRHGESAKWFAPDHDDKGWKPIRIGKGHFWDNQGYRDYDGVAWYRRRFTVPKSLQGKPVLVAFGAVDESARLYIDGELAGEHDIGPLGWDKRFVLDVTQHVEPGVEQTWAIRVLDTQRAGGIWKPVHLMTRRSQTGVHTLNLRVRKDAMIRRNEPDHPYGKDKSLTVGSKDYFRTVLAWQLSAPLKTVEVRRAMIELRMRSVTKSGSYRIMPFTTDWQERTVTWNQRNASDGWDEPAGGKEQTFETFRVPGSDKMESSKGKPRVLEIDVTRFVRESGSRALDIGFLIQQSKLDPNANFSMHSREAKRAEDRPTLTIKYELR